MKIGLICEESQAVTIAFRAKGHEAYSVDVVKCSGGHPEWHIQKDAREVLEDYWDMIIAFPPCTRLCVSGARWFKKYIAEQKAAADFFMLFANHKCPKIGIENPIGIMSRLYRKPDQIIQPYQFGHKEQKATCLWLKGLPKLIPTKNVRAEMMALPKRERERVHYLPPSLNRGALRSKTYQGIAAAMADQWG
jgi:hypothetical protein